MINAEKFKKEILKTKDANYWFSIDKLDNQFKTCGKLECSNCLINSDADEKSCRHAQIEWLLSEYREPIKLSILEYEFLKWLEKEGYKYIVRDRENNLFIFKDAPTKRRDYWASKSGYNPISLFNNLFKSVQLSDEEPTSIKDVLENCEVVEDDL